MRERTAAKAYPTLLPLLARAFSGPVVRELQAGRLPRVLSDGLRAATAAGLVSDKGSLLDALKAAFRVLQRAYRSDYVYRAAIAKHLVFKEHRPADVALLPEFRVWRSHADLLLLNGTSVAFEIKSELDNLDRLESQVETYSRAFDHIVVVTHAERSDAVLAKVAPHVGVLIMDQALTVSTVRAARPNAQAIDIPTVVDALRRREVVELTRRLTGAVPDVGAFELISACRAALSAARPDRVHAEMVALLKERQKLQPREVKAVPWQLFPAFLESGLPSWSWPEVTKALTSRCVASSLR